MRGTDAEYRDDVGRVLEQAERALDTWTVQHTVFLPPPVVAEAMIVLKRLADLAAIPWGGYPQSERCRIALGREQDLAGALENPASLNIDSIAAIDVQGNFLFDPATHRDFLGACLGTGIERQVVGDIIVQGDRGAIILVAPPMVEHLTTSLVQVRSVPVKVRTMPLSELRVPAARVLELASVESSMRLDALASAGFRMSRSKMADMIKGGDVRVNWKPSTKPSVEVAEGDVISVSGKGRVEIKSVVRTSKGKYRIEMVKYV